MYADPTGSYCQCVVLLSTFIAPILNDSHSVPWHVEEELMRLRTSTNTFPFISLLPTEILEDIFIRCAWDCYRAHKFCVTPAVPCWVNISYVCRHWRTVALAYPTLWTYVFITSQCWTEELLARSKQASLKISTDLRYVQDKSPLLKHLDELMDHIERVQELHLKLPASYFHQVLSKLSPGAPRLQHLSLTTRGPSLPWSLSDFQADTPSLRALELSGCLSLLYLFKLGALTTLALYDASPYANIVEFLAALRHMKDLKHLYVSHALASATGFLSSAAFKTFEKVDLPCLTRLSISVPLSAAVASLSCINVPSKTEVRLSCGSKSDLSFDNHTLLYSLLSQRYHNATNQALSTSTTRSLLIEYSEFMSARLTFSAYERSFTPLSDDRWDYNVPLEIELDLLGIDEHRIISDICCAMPLSNVQSLSVVRPPESPAFWLKTLGHLHDVRYVKLSCGSVPDLSMLSPTTLATYEGQGQSHILVPRLEELELEEITFLPQGYSRRLLFDALSERQGSRGRLTMNRCGTGDRFVDLLMVWDDGEVHVVDERVYSDEEEEHWGDEAELISEDSSYSDWEDDESEPERSDDA